MDALLVYVPNALEVLQSAVLTPQRQPDPEGIWLCLLNKVSSSLMPKVF